MEEEQGNRVERHPFEPFLPAGARVLVLGTFPPQRKRWCVEFYYPNWNNDFWRIMGWLFYGDRDRFCDTVSRVYRLDDIKRFLCERGIAIYDTAVEVVRLRDNASDKFLDIRRGVDLGAVLERCPDLDTVVTAGERATAQLAAMAGVEPPAMGGCVTLTCCGRELRHWRMPSTSRAYPLSLERKAAMYAKVFCR